MHPKTHTCCLGLFIIYLLTCGHLALQENDDRYVVLDLHVVLPLLLFHQRALI